MMIVMERLLMTTFPHVQWSSHHFIVLDTVMNTGKHMYAERCVLYYTGGA